MSKIKFSVIIPVYNAERFVRKSVESALSISEVGEVILVEDKSPDNALEICKNLDKEYDRVKLFRHPKGENRGVSASRNLGIENAKHEFIAFLDADDWYLPNRFTKDIIAIEQHPDADGIFSYPVLENERGNFTEKKDPKQSLGHSVRPVEFYQFFLKNRYPFFHPNTVTFRKSFLLEEKMFDERLQLHEDSEMWLRTLRRGNFYPGELTKPVAMIRRHEGNRITSRDWDSKLLFLAVFIQNVQISNLHKFEKIGLFKNILRAQSKRFSSDFQRRLYFYSKFMLFKFRKDFFLAKFVDSILSKPA